MGQKVNPIANRLGIIRGWDSNWFGGKDFSDKLVEDAKIRKYLNVRLAKASISKIIIERTLKLVTVTISTARPGIIIGKGGQEVDKLKEELKKLTGKEIQINIFEVKRPEVDAVIVGQNIARQLEGRVSFRRAVKTAVASTMRMGAEGIKVQVSGRVGGAEMPRSETIKEGRIPLHTFRADVDYCLTEALTKVGILGVKVWIYKGEVLNSTLRSENPEPAKRERRDRRPNDRRNGDRRGNGERRPYNNDRRSYNGERRPYNNNNTEGGNR